MILVQAVKAYLESKGITEKITMGHAPAVPDTLITLYDTGGYGPDRDVPLVNPTVMIQTRGDYLTANALAWQCLRSLNRETMYDLSGIHVKKAFAITEPRFIGQDDETRTIFTFDVVFQVEEFDI